MAMMMKGVFGVVAAVLLASFAAAGPVCRDAVFSEWAEMQPLPNGKMKCYPMDTSDGDRVAIACFGRSAGGFKVVFIGNEGFDLMRVEAKVAGTQWLLMRRPLAKTNDPTGGPLGRKTALTFPFAAIPSNSDGCCNEKMWLELYVAAMDGNDEFYEAQRSVSRDLVCSEQCSSPGVFAVGKCTLNDDEICKGCQEINPTECYTSAGEILSEWTDSKSCQLPDGRLGMYRRPHDGSLECECVELVEGFCMDKPEENSWINKCTLPDGSFGNVTGTRSDGSDDAPPQCECAAIAVDECIDMNHYPNHVTDAVGGACVYDGINGIFGETIGKWSDNTCKCGPMPADKCYESFDNTAQPEIMDLNTICAPYWFDDYLQEPGTGIYARDEYRMECECDFLNL